MMKKIIFTILIAIPAAAGLAAFSNHTTGTNRMLISFGSAGQTHEFRMIDDLKFRYEEYNDYKDVEENKREKAQEEFKLTEPAMQKIYNSRPQPSQNVQFVEQDGQIKIQSIQ